MLLQNRTVWMYTVQIASRYNISTYLVQNTKVLLQKFSSIYNVHTNKMAPRNDRFAHKFDVITKSRFKVVFALKRCKYTMVQNSRFIKTYLSFCFAYKYQRLPILCKWCNTSFDRFETSTSLTLERPFFLSITEKVYTPSLNRNAICSDSDHFLFFLFMMTNVSENFFFFQRIKNKFLNRHSHLWMSS